MEYSRKKRYAFINALCLSLLFLGFVLLTGVVWESDDDQAIAYLLSRADTDFSPFQWRLLSVILHFLYMQLPVINWWMACSVFSVWLAMLLVSYVIFRGNAPLTGWLMSLFLAVFLWFAAIYRVNFTRTAAVTAMAGCLLIADSIFSDQKAPVQYGVGCITMLLGASVRSRCGMIALAFLAVIGLVKLLCDHFSFKPAWFRQHLRQILLLCLAACVYFGAAKLDQQLRTDEQQAYVQYNALRSSIQDYAHRYPSYEEAAEAYAGIGIEERTLNILIHWFSEDTEVFDTETLQQISALASEEISLDGLFPLPTDHSGILLSCFVLLLMLLLAKKGNWLRIGAVFLLTALLCAYLAIGGRFPARVFEPMLWCSACAVFYLCAESPPRACSGAPGRRVLSVVCSCLLLGTSLALCLNVRTLLLEDGSTRSRAYQDAAAAEGRAVLDAIDADQENLYIFDIFLQPTSVEDAFSCWEARPARYCENRFVLGGWEARHPYLVDLLAEQGITNPVTALFGKTNVYSMYSRRTLTHLRIHYYNRMTVSETKVLCGYPLVQYAAPIDDTLLTYSTGASAVVTQIEYSGKENSSWYLQADVSALENGTGVYYCNLTLNNMRYTYRLGCDGSSVYAHLYGLGQDYDWSGANLQIFQLMSDGSYRAYLF